MQIKKIIIGVVVLLVIVIAGYLGWDYYEQDQLAKQQEADRVKQEQMVREQAEKAAADLSNRTKCNESGNYFVVTLDHEYSAVGQDILVKQKVEGQSCKYEVAEGDFEIKNSDPEYFKAIGQSSLVSDVGTGPSMRSFRLYDLSEKKLIVEKKYFEELKVSSTSLTYFGLAKTEASKKNCTDYDKLMKDFGNANLVVEKTIDLKTYSVKEGKTTKCVANQ